MFLAFFWTILPSSKIISQKSCPKSYALSDDSGGAKLYVLERFMYFREASISERQVYRRCDPLEKSCGIPLLLTI